MTAALPNVSSLVELGKLLNGGHCAVARKRTRYCIHLWRLTMRTRLAVAAFSLTLVISACSKGHEQPAGLPDDLKRDLAAASVPTSDLAVAPQGYKRMRFVSDIEQTRGTVVALRAVPSRRHEHMLISHRSTSGTATDIAPDPMASLAAAMPAPTATASSSAITPSVEVSARPAPTASPAPVGDTQDGTVGDSHGRGIGSVLAGILGGVVIRGGPAGSDKCDPRTDARANGTIRNRPDFGLPVPTGRVFGGGSSSGGIGRY
jgi:hypothetical protein